MAKKSTKEKKLRRKKNQEAKLQEEQIKFDIIDLLINEPLETKAEVGDFLKKYVKSIRLYVNYSTITIYPVNEYSISRIFVDFLDGHGIVAILNRQPKEYYLDFRMNDIELKEKETKYIISFIQKLYDFQFILK